MKNLNNLNLLAFGEDPNEHHTARQLPIHKAECNWPKDCRILLLELSQILGE
jgi:hypothetical protein